MLGSRIRLDELRPEIKATTKLRWFRAYSATGRADTFVRQLSSYVRRNRLGDTVCGVSLERRPKGEFYLFLTLESDYFGVLPSDVEELLSEFPLLRASLGDSQDRSEFSKFVGKELTIATLGQCIDYRELQREVLDDPFAESIHVDREISQSAEAFFAYLSSMGSGSWPAFSKVGRAFGFTAQGDATRLAKALKLLGHMELSPNGEYWSITASVAVQVQDRHGSSLTYLAGARTVHEIGERIEQDFGPDRLQVNTATSQMVEEPGLTMIAALPHAGAYPATLLEVGGLSQYNNSFARREAGAFVKVKTADSPGFYEITSGQGNKHAYLLDLEGKWRTGDWYGLNYIDRHMHDLLTAAEYDSSSWTLAIMADQRPPELYERSLVLASGLLPTINSGWLHYGNISPELAALTCGKLGLTIKGLTS